MLVEFSFFGKKMRQYPLSLVLRHDTRIKNKTIPEKYDLDS